MEVEAEFPSRRASRFRVWNERLEREKELLGPFLAPVVSWRNRIVTVRLN